jgi:RNA polymerase sigma-70 factor (ECF subfamily)
MSKQRREFLELLDLHGPSLLAMLRRLSRNPHDAEDVLQETAIRVWRSFGQRPILRSPRAWLMTIAYRAFLDHSHRKSSQEALQDIADHHDNKPDSIAEYAEDCSRVRTAIDELPADLRQVIVLHYTAQMTIRETAKAMNISVGTAKSRLNAALVKLRRIMT